MSTSTEESPSPSLATEKSPASRDKGQWKRRYIALARQCGCPLEQINNYLRAKLLAQEKQLLFAAATRQCDIDGGPTEVGFGGARGGGKSWVLLAQMGADDCQRRPGLKCLLLRKVGKANIEHFQDLRLRLFSDLPHSFDRRGILQFENGSRIIAGHFQSETDIDAYLGLEYDVIGVEEATTLTGRKYRDISTCCRTSKQDWRPRIYSTTNPGGVGHASYRAKFILPFQAGNETQTRFIPSRVEDNKFNNPDYVRVLESLTGWQLRAWRHGDWDISAGQFFTTFRQEVHIEDDFDKTCAVNWQAALDYGYVHFTIFLLAGTDSDGVVHVVGEHAERLWLPERHADAIESLLHRHGVAFHQLRNISAGTDVFGRQSDGTTVAEQYQKEGVRLTPANMDRVNGWAEILKRLGDVDRNIRPTLRISRKCPRLIECLPALQHDPNRPEDVMKMDVDEDGIGGDDAADALRYMLATKPSGALTGVEGIRSGNRPASSFHPRFKPMRLR